MLIATHQCTHPRRVEPSSKLLGELQILHFFSTKSKTLEIQLQDNKCLQIREVVQQLAIDMHQRFLPQGKMAFKQTTPFYLLPKLRMFGVLPLLPHTLAGCRT
jgi:hypothetical protein